MMNSVLKTRDFASTPRKFASKTRNFAFKMRKFAFKMMNCAETPTRASFEQSFARRNQVQLVLMVIGGGPGTIEMIIESMASHEPVLIIKGSGGVADILASMINGDDSVLARVRQVRKNDEFCIQNETFCIKNEEFVFKMMNFAGSCVKQARGKVPSAG